jgi:nitrous oxidase accessory protein
MMARAAIARLGAACLVAAALVAASHATSGTVRVARGAQAPAGHAQVGEPPAAPPVTRTLDVGPAFAYTTITDALQVADTGDTIAVHGGVHNGPFVVEKGLALVGIGRPVLDGGGVGTVVRLEGEGAHLSGFAITNSGSRLDKEDAGIGVYATASVVDNTLEDVLFGIDIQRAPNSVIARNRITGRDLDMPRRGDAVRAWESRGTSILNNVIDRSRDLVVWYSDDVTMIGNVVTNSRYGLHFMYASGSVVERNSLERNAVGAYAMYSSNLSYNRNEFSGNHGPSGYGLALKESSAITITGNVIAGNRTGIYFDNSPLEPDTYNWITHNAIVNNDIGLAFVPSVKRNVFRENRFVDNYEQVAVVASGTFEGNEWTVDGVGNFWSNYAGFDADADGIGDIAHVEASLFHDLLATEPVLRLFSHTPAQSAIDLAARAFPVFRPPPILQDDAPLSEAPALEAGAVHTSPWPMVVVGIMCVTASAGVVGWARRPFGRGGPGAPPLDRTTTVAALAAEGVDGGASRSVPPSDRVGADD